MAVTNTPDKSELLPCPFCGAKLVGTIEQGFGHSSDSPDCILQYGCVDSHDIERWNTRSRPPADQVLDMVPGQHKADCDNHWCQGGDDCKRWAALQAVPAASGEVGWPEGAETCPGCGGAGFTL